MTTTADHQTSRRRADHRDAPAPDRSREPQHATSDLRIRALDRLPTPREFVADLPLGARLGDLVTASRSDVRKVLRGEDDRLLVIVGPCSIHDPDAALDYAERLAAAARRHSGDLLVVMRAYFEKPRTTVGWKGLINDPHLDGTHDVHHGLRLAREVLLSILDTGLPVACEFLEPTSPQYLADAVTWGAIGARNSESQVHRQLASGLSMPVGFKNATDGDVQVAIDGCVTAASEHLFFGADADGRAAAVRTTGNPDCHVILRGGRGGPNYAASDVAAALDLARRSRLDGPVRAGVVVDAAHGNSGKDHVREAEVVRELAARLAGGEAGITGVMIESFLAAGRQEPAPVDELAYGRSVTDPCLDWATTQALLEDLAAAVRRRRAGADGAAPSGPAQE